MTLEPFSSPACRGVAAPPPSSPRRSPPRPRGPRGGARRRTPRAARGRGNRAAGASSPAPRRPPPRAAPLRARPQKSGFPCAVPTKVHASRPIAVRVRAPKRSIERLFLTLKTSVRARARRGRVPSVAARAMCRCSSTKPSGARDQSTFVRSLPRNQTEPREGRAWRPTAWRWRG